MTWNRWLLAGLIGASVAAACGGGGNGGGIGPEGGTVTSDDGRVTLTIPAGALGQSEEITIREVSADEVILIDELLRPSLGRAYEMKPDGVTFAVPATVEVETDAMAIVGAQAAVADLLAAYIQAGQLAAIENMAQEPDAAGTIHLTGTTATLGTLLVTDALGADDGVSVSLIGDSPACYGANVPVTLRISKEATSTFGASSVEASLAAEPDLVGADIMGEDLGNIPPTAQPATIDFTYLVACDGAPTTGRVLAAVTFRMWNFSTYTFDVHTVRLAFPIECIDCGAQIVEGVFASLLGTEGVAPLSPPLLEIGPAASPGSIPLFEDDTYVAVAGENGQAVHRLSDGTIAHDFRAAGTSTYLTIGANNSLVSVGPDGYSDRRYNATTGMFGFAQLGLFGQNITDAAPIPGAVRGVHGVLLANNSVDQIERLDPVIDMFGGFTLAAPLPINLGLVTGEVVSLWSPPGEGPFLGVSNSNIPGTPGELFWVDPADPGGLVVVGTVPEGPRRIRCLEPAGSICAVSSYVAGAITLIDWPNRAAPPTIGPTTVAVAGPVGIDLAQVGGMPTVASTGFIDGTLHLTTIGAGLVPADQSTPLPNCADPGHVIFVPGETHVVVTCNGSDAFEVIALPVMP